MQCPTALSVNFLEDVPLGEDDGLHEDAEEEEERLVHGGQVDPGVERDQEDELHQQGGVDEDVGEAGAHPDGHAGGVTSLQSVGEAQGRPQEQSCSRENSFSLVYLVLLNTYYLTLTTVTDTDTQ